MTFQSGRCVRLLTVLVGVIGVMIAATAPAAAQDVSINFGQGSGLTERVVQLIALLTVLSLAPSILVMMTSFTRAEMANSEVQSPAPDLCFAGLVRPPVSVVPRTGDKAARWSEAVPCPLPHS